MKFLRPLLTVFICIALLWARLSGAHLHICLDGQEPPASIETELRYSSGSPDGPLVSVHESTNDLEIDLLGGLFGADTVKGKLSLPLLAMTITTFVVLLLVPLESLVLPSTRRRDFLPKHPPRFSPPLCGPPTFSVA